MTNNQYVIKKTLYLEQLIELFPQKLERASVWTTFFDGSIATEIVTETVDETILKLVIPADEVTLYLNGEDEVILLTEYHEGEVFSTLRGVEEK